MENEEGESSNQNNNGESENSENESDEQPEEQQSSSNPAVNLVRRIRRLVSQSTFHENELDNQENNYPQNNEDENERLFEEYCNQASHSNEPRADFDVELPIQHSYLGECENVKGLTFFEANKSYELPVCSHHSLIYPGEILPMIMLQDRFFSRSTDDDEGLIFGLIFNSEMDENKEVFGVTCQVYEKGLDNRGHITVKAKAHQRFKVIKTEDGEIAISRNNICYAKVSILPEILLPDPHRLTLTSNYVKHFLNASTSAKTKSFASASTRWPSFVYEHYSISKVTEKIERYLAMLNIESPRDPIEKSFWLARNVPLNQSDRLTIFKHNCVNKRLLLIGAGLNYMCYFLCKRCRNKIAIYNDIFAMSKDNVNANYCNPAGYIHETLTVTKTLDSAVNMVDRPSTEFSWFPGYAWQIAVCSKCHTHIGWRFVAIKDKNLRPRTFFGLSCKSLIVNTEGKEESEDEGDQLIDDSDSSD